MNHTYILQELRDSAIKELTFIITQMDISYTQVEFNPGSNKVFGLDYNYFKQIDLYVNSNIRFKTFSFIVKYKLLNI